MEGRKKHVPPEGKQLDGTYIRHKKRKLFGKEIVVGYEVVSGSPQEPPQQPISERKPRFIRGTDIPIPPSVSFIEKSQTKGDLKDD